MSDSKKAFNNAGKSRAIQLLERLNMPEDDKIYALDMIGLLFEMGFEKGAQYGVGESEKIINRAFSREEGRSE